MLKMLQRTYGSEFYGDPSGLLEQMKKDGFKFDSESCPIKLSEPKEIHPNDDGTVTYTQWDPNDSDIEWIA
jgi:hypothetical protein